MRKSLAVVCLVLTMMLIWSGCTNQGAPSEPEISIKVTDQKGREITVNKAVNKIVSLAPSNTEMLFALGLGDKVVGVTEYCNYPPEAATIEKVGGFQGPNVEKIVSLAPDVVFSSGMEKEPVDMLEQAGIIIVVLEPKSIEQVYEAANIMGKVAQVEAQAETLVNNLKERMQTVQAKVKDIPEDEKPLVYYEIWHDPPMTVGPNTFLHEIIVQAGGRNLSSDAVTDYPTYSAEDVIYKNPDVILLGHGGQKSDEVVQRDGWSEVSAVKNGRIVAVDQDIFSRPGPRVVDAVEWLAAYLYPEK